MFKALLEKYGLTAQAVIRATDCTGCVNLFPLSPVPSVRNLAQKPASLAAVSAFEMSRSFCGKVLACCGELGIEMKRTNVLGGALALRSSLRSIGRHHPAAPPESTGTAARLLGIATVGAVGGQGVSILIERCAEPCA